MNIDPILKQISELTAQDTKTLSQKGLKLAEEVGELAAVLLPYDNAAGTLHRFVLQQQILEEAIDVILCAASIIENVGFSKDDIADMFNAKLAKWGSLQAGESKVKDADNIPFEIHVSVSITDGGQLELFQHLCTNIIHVKPIVLDLDWEEGTMRDVMTSSTIFSSSKDAVIEMTRISDTLERHGLIVSRKKVETVPWHPAAPHNEHDTMPPNCYFECHIPIAINPTEIDQLRMHTHQVGLHLSRNAFKKLDGDNVIMMATLRSVHGNYKSFQFSVDYIKHQLEQWKYVIVDNKIITEFAIYDSNISLDNKWVNRTEQGKYGRLQDFEELYTFDEED